MGGKSLESKKLTVLMIDQCRERGLPPPVWKSDEKLGVTVTFSVPEVEPQLGAQQGAQSLADQAGKDIGATAGGARHHHGDGLGGPALR